MDFFDFRGAYKPTGGRVGVRTGGPGRKRCTKGKSCGATCIAATKVCRIDLGGQPGSNGGKNLHDGLGNVRGMLQGRKQRSQGAVPTTQPKQTPAPTPQPKPQPQPQSQPKPPVTRTTSQQQAARDKQQREKEQEQKLLQGAKNRASEDLEVAAKNTLAAKSVKEASVKVKERQEASGEAQRIMNQRQDATKLSDAQARAIRTYTSDRDIRGVNQYQNLNNCLRNPGACKNASEAQALQKELDSALSALPKNTNNFQFTRVIPLGKETTQLYDYLKNAQKGSILEDPAFGSFTSDKSHAAGLSNPVWGKTIKLVTRSGQIVPVNQYSNIKDEAEGILPRGSKLKISRVVEDQNGITAFLDD